MNENNESRKGIFFGIIGVLTLIVAIIGATLAYFTARDGSAVNEVQVKSAQLTVSYLDGETITGASDLIPASTAVATTAANRTGDQNCLDDNGREVCAIYSFKIKNEGSISQNVMVTISSGLNQFTNLSYLVYEVTNTPATSILGSTVLPAEGYTKSLVGANVNDDITIGIGETKHFNVIIYLLETGEPQDEEQGQQYAGTIDVRISGVNASGEITGVIH